MIAHRVIDLGLCVTVIIAAVFLRFQDLGVSPMHADEATGARIVADRLEGAGYEFDPVHFHGPTLSLAGAVVAHFRGEFDWLGLTAISLRLVTAVAGCLTVALLVFWRHRLGNAGALTAAALLAISPLLVTFSRTFIHETILGFFALLTLTFLSAWDRRNPWAAAVGVGLGLGLMFATKETFVVSVAGWTFGGTLVWLEARRRIRFRRWWRPAALVVAVAAATAFVGYAGGLADAVRTFFVYETTPGHTKPFGYYAKLMISAEPGIVLLAAAGFALGWIDRGSRLSRQARFLGWATAAQFLCYSVLAYKVPWLAVVPWIQACLLAGCGVGLIMRCRSSSRIAVAAGCVALIGLQTQRVAVCNPYAYAATSPDAAAVAEMLGELRPLAVGPWRVAVVGSGYWPLPWVLRGQDPVGYWPNPSDEMAHFPVVIALPSEAVAVGGQLADSHAVIFRGLREEVLLSCFVRRDLWDRWMEEVAR